MAFGWRRGTLGVVSKRQTKSIKPLESRRREELKAWVVKIAFKNLNPLFLDVQLMKASLEGVFLADQSNMEAN